jgi:hypothetical protein
VFVGKRVIWCVSVQVQENKRAYFWPIAANCTRCTHYKGVMVPRAEQICVLRGISHFGGDGIGSQHLLLSQSGFHAAYVTSGLDVISESAPFETGARAGGRF